MTDLVAKFLECHERIRRFTLGLTRLAELDDLRHPLAPATAEACHRYFRDGLPLHGQDEDESLAPRLRVVAPHVGEALDRMTAEHGEMETILPELLPMLAAIAAGSPPDVQAYRGPATRFAALMLGHIELEEQVIFPACGALDEAERLAVVAEMGARRR